IERRHPRLDHQNIRAFFRATDAGSDRAAAIAHVELIMSPITKLWRRIRSVAKRSIKIAGELRAVTHHRNEIETIFVEGRANADYAPVHHVARADAISAGFSKRDCRFRQLIESFIQVDSLFIQHRTMSVRRVRAETGVDPQAKAVSKLP